MQRDEVIETLAALAAPLGPMTSIDEWLAWQARTIDEGGLPLFHALTDLLASPPREDQLRGTPREEWRDMLVEIASILAKRHREAALDRLLPLLDHEQARPGVIEILGAIADQRAVPELARLVRDRRVAARDLVPLACTLGEIGGPDACILLAHLQEAATPDQRELLQEIEIARQAAGCGQQS
jgi:hypothetical protein